MQTTLTRILIELESVSDGFPKLQTKFLGKLWKFEGFFRPKSGVLQKKKKSSPKLRLIFRPSSQTLTFEGGGCYCMGGGLFSIFHRKSASKAQKTCDFAYFTSQWGGGSCPPPPSYATG